MTRHRPLPAPLEEIPFVLRLESMIPPLSWSDIFGRDLPVELEIGSGKGRFLLEAAARSPATGFVGVERAGKWFLRSVERAARAGLPNLRLVRADAFDFLSRWVPVGSLAALHVYFPDPWPKKRHAKRRLLQDGLFLLGARALPPERPFLLGSDVGTHFEESVSRIVETGLFMRVPWPADSPDRLATNYAVKYAREGRTLHYARFLRTERPAPASLSAGSGARGGTLDPDAGLLDAPAGERP